MIEGLQCFVDDNRIAIGARRRRGQHIQPAWRDDRRAERDVTRIDEEYGHLLTQLESASWPYAKTSARERWTKSPKQPEHAGADGFPGIGLVGLSK